MFLFLLHAGRGAGYMMMMCLKNARLFSFFARIVCCMLYASLFSYEVSEFVCVCARLSLCAFVLWDKSAQNRVLYIHTQ